MYAFCSEYENTADNPRLVNLSEQQYQYLRSMEKRRFGRAYECENSIDRIERLEIEYFDEPQKGNISERLKNLRMESTRDAISGTAMTPMMQSTFNSSYISPRTTDTSHYNEVGLIDGFIRLWWPDLYEDLKEYRKIKDLTFE
jgi:hypothetical protein